LSALGTSLAAGVMCLLILEITAMPLMAISVSVLFSVLPNIWEMAVVTEVYNVNIFFLGCSLYLIIRAEKRGFAEYLLPAATFFGLSLGTYQANLLLFPVFIMVLILGVPRNRLVESLVKFCSVVIFIWFIFLSYTVVRSHEPLPLGRPLNSYQSVVAYVSGKDLRPAFPANIEFYIDRLMSHTGLFSKNFLYIPIPIGILGVYTLFRQRRNAAIFLGGVLVINYLFFSFYAVSDYFTMPTPSYFIFSVFVGCGLATLSQMLPIDDKYIEFVGFVLYIILVVIQLFNQFPSRYERSNTLPVTELVLPALKEFPRNAIVISRWERFAPLLYFQQVYEIREDVTLVVSNDFTKQIDTYYANAPYRPLLIDNKSDDLKEKYEIERYYRRWFLILSQKKNR
jgi:hypothetical protein